MGAPPALLWAADHPEEIRGLLYMEVPVMLSAVLSRIISYTPEAMQKGSMWWWILPLAPGVPERLVVGNEREFLTWFFESAVSKPGAIPEETIDEYLRTFSGRRGVLGAMGVYRAAFATIAQTEPLQTAKVQVPIVAVGGAKAQGDKVREMVAMVAANVTGHVLHDCGHFLPEECPEEIVRLIFNLSKQTSENPHG
jgi:pimeloyl-ACP methyl ester carboxylesterase